MYRWHGGYYLCPCFIYSGRGAYLDLLCSIGVSALSLPFAFNGVRQVEDPNLSDEILLQYSFRFVTVAGAGVCASLQSSSAALTTIFDDPFFMQGVMSGQGAIGFSVAITQFLSALNSIQKNHQGGQKPGGAPPGAPNDGHALVTSTFNFLVISLLFTFIAGIATYVLIKLPCYEHAMERHTKIEAAQMNDEIDPSEATHVQTQHHKSSIWQVNRKIRDLGWALAFLYTISIGLFPSITMSIASVNPSSTFSSVSDISARSFTLAQEKAHTDT